MREQFTKGPWNVNDSGFSAIIVECDNSIICECGHPKSGAITDANLIATAPEMYAMLEEVLYNIEVGNSDYFEINEDMAPAIKDLLTKARGEK